MKPINSSLLTITLYSSVRTATVYDGTKHSVPFMMLILSLTVLYLPMNIIMKYSGLNSPKKPKILFLWCVLGPLRSIHICTCIGQVKGNRIYVCMYMCVCVYIYIYIYMSSLIWVTEIILLYVYHELYIYELCFQFLLISHISKML